MAEITKIVLTGGPCGGKTGALGFLQKELTDRGVVAATLGKRILRAQTAPVAALCAAMLLTGNLE